MKELNIAVNVRHLIPDKMEGIGWYSYQIMKRLTQQHPDVHFYFLFDRNFSDEFIFSDNITPIILTPPARHPLLIYIWNEWTVPNLLNKLKPDVYLSLDGFISKRSKYKQYAVVHDINFVVFPEHLTWSIKKLYDYFFVKHIHYANRIATVSEYSKSEIVQYLHYSEDKIDIIPNASNLKFRDILPNEEQHIKAQFTNGKNYFLYVGSIHPRKNIIGLINAFNLYKKNSLTDDKLVIVGRFFWGKREVMDVVEKSPFKNDIIFTGRLNDDTTMVLMKFAKALVMVSFYEGFGVPVIEAMQLGTPVICSNTTALNEVAGNAALKVNPQDIQEIAKGMQTISTNSEVVKNLISKGKEQAQKYNWDISANKLWDEIMKLSSN
ncbi:MAG: glycosyl transferase [Bacteroidia bacterium]|nr:MAG: glycosyl transferase [Bacteroidia bacterium]